MVWPGVSPAIILTQLLRGLPLSLPRSINLTPFMQCTAVYTSYFFAFSLRTRRPRNFITSFLNKVFKKKKTAVLFF